MLCRGRVFDGVIGQVGENLLQRDEVGVQGDEFGALVVLHLHAESCFLQSEHYLAEGPVNKLGARRLIGSPARLASCESGEGEHVFHQVPETLALLVQRFVVFIELFGGHDLVLEHLGHE